MVWLNDNRRLEIFRPNVFIDYLYYSMENDGNASRFKDRIYHQPAVVLGMWFLVVAALALAKSGRYEDALACYESLASAFPQHERIYIEPVRKGMRFVEKTA